MNKTITDNMHRVSNGTGQCNFSGHRDRQNFLSPDKGTTGQAQNLAKGQAGPGQPKFRTGRDSQKPGRDTRQNGTEQKRMF